MKASPILSVTPSLPPLFRKPTLSKWRAKARHQPPDLQLSGIDGWEWDEAGSDGGDDPTATPDLVRRKRKNTRSETKFQFFAHLGRHFGRLESEEKLQNLRFKMSKEKL